MQITEEMQITEDGYPQKLTCCANWSASTLKQYKKQNLPCGSWQVRSIYLYFTWCTCKPRFLWIQSNSAGNSCYIKSACYLLLGWGTLKCWTLPVTRCVDNAVKETLGLPSPGAVIEGVQFQIQLCSSLEPQIYIQGAKFSLSYPP